MLRKVVPFMLMAFAILSLTALAGQYDKAEKGSEALEGSDAAKGEAEHVTLTGTMVCLGRDLHKAESARAACDVYGHRHALKTDDGRYYNILENKYGEALIKGEKYHNKKMEIHGVYFASANQLDVEAFQPEGSKKLSWCDHCKSMDACMAK